MDKSSRTAQAGMTLIGVLLSLLLLVTTVVIMSKLLAGRGDVTQRSRETMVATNIAREGLELVRAMRDGNWLSSQLWTTELCAAPDAFVVDADTIASGRPLRGEVENNGLLYQRSTSSSSPVILTHRQTSEATPFRRIIKVDCTQANNPLNSGTPQFMTVTATVTWSSRGQSREVVLVEKLFNWFEGT